MRVFQKIILLKTQKMYDFVNITKDVENIVKESNLTNGIIFVNALHSTAALILQENDETIFQDMINMFERILPSKGSYKHSYEGNENATAHLKSNLLGTSLTIPLINGKPELGTWRDIFFVELFEGRQRKIEIIIIGE